MRQVVQRRLNRRRHVVAVHVDVYVCLVAAQLSRLSRLNALLIIVQLLQLMRLGRRTGPLHQRLAVGDVCKYKTKAYYNF